MKRWIEVRRAPKGFGLQQWPFDAFVNVAMPILSEEEIAQIAAEIWLGPEITGPKYVVRLCEAIVSLQAANQDRAVGFWQAVIDAQQLLYICFEGDVCALVAGPDL